MFGFDTTPISDPAALEGGSHADNVETQALEAPAEPPLPTQPEEEIPATQPFMLAEMPHPVPEPPAPPQVPQMMCL